MQKLYVLYDGKCELCCKLRDWLQRQEQWLELKMMPAGSAEARQLFPGLERIASANDLAVVSDEGEVYLNNRAWIMCLYALREYRNWACKMAHPLLLPLARQAFAAISKSRWVISRWLAQDNPERIAGELRLIPLPSCSVPEETISDYLR